MINERPEAVANQVRGDVHAPAKFRVIGPLSNIPEFYSAFGVKEGDAGEHGTVFMKWTLIDWNEEITII